MKLSIRLCFERHDCWIGVYWDRCEIFQDTYIETTIYICLVPMFPIVITTERWLP